MTFHPKSHIPPTSYRPLPTYLPDESVVDGQVLGRPLHLVVQVQRDAVVQVRQRVARLQLDGLGVGGVRMSAGRVRRRHQRRGEGARGARRQHRHAAEQGLSFVGLIGFASHIRAQ